jgi:membrane protein DedA with SNARE-associated domain
MMTELMAQAANFLQQTIGAWGYLGVFLAAFLENIFPPIPSEFIMPFAGFLVGRGELGFVGIVVAGTAGMVLGGLPLYYLGMWADAHVLRSALRRYGRWFGVSERDLDRVLRLFDQHGSAIVLFGRLIPLVRTLIAVPAGMDRMPLPKYLFYSTIGSAIWTAVLAYTGVLLGENWEDVLVFVQRYERFAIVAGIVIVALVAVAIAARRYSQSRSARSGVDSFVL